MKISTNFLVDCNFLSPMVANGDVGAGFSIASIKSSSTLVAGSWLDAPGILLCSVGNYTISAIRPALFLLT